MIISFIGVTMTKQAYHEVTASSDFSSISKANIAAESGLIQTINLIENDGNSFLPILQSAMENPNNDNWLLGNNSSYINFDNKHSFRTQIVNFDSSNFNITLRSEAIGISNVSKTVLGIYNLDGIDFKEITSTGNAYALYVNGNFMNFQSKFHLIGNVYTPGELNFIGSWCSGSIFDGNVISSGTGTSNLQGTFTFTGKFYVKGNLNILPGSLGGKRVTFQGMTGLEKTLSKGGDLSSEIIIEDNCFVNSNLGGGSPVIDNLNGKIFTHNGSADFSKVINGVETINASLNIPEEMSITSSINPPPPTLDISQIPVSNILNWDDLAMDAFGNPGLAGYSSSDLPQYGAYATLWPGIMDAYTLQRMCNYSRSVNKKWNGFTIIRIPSTRTVYPITNNGEFTDSVIFINDGFIDQSSAPSAGWYNSSRTSMTVIINYGSFNCGQYTGNNTGDPTTADLFRAYIFNTTNAGTFQLNPATRVFYNFLGAIHNMRDPSSTAGTDIWYPDNGTNLSRIEYDSGMLQYIAGTGLFQNIGGGTPTTIKTNELEIVDGTIGINAVLLGQYN